MQFVAESTIDQVIGQLESDADTYDIQVEAFEQSQPVVMAYLVSDNFDLLTQDEREFMLYVALIIWQSSSKTNPELPSVSEQQLEDAEEANYELFETLANRPLHERFDRSFDEYPQEDLLAFVEDVLMAEDEPDASEPLVTPEGLEPMFVGLKSIIDAFHRA